ncbi:MAG: aminopeptidase [Candidatus Aenigmarchaeota archaeon]|nr:aminopeptidase [Candidatus Aenigmarchaeota archaeon]
MFTLSTGLRKKLSKHIIASMNMKEGESLLIRAGLHEQELAEQLSIDAMKTGIDSLLSTTSDNYTKSVYKEIPVKFLKKPSKLSLKMVEALDNLISLEKPKDPRILENISHKKIAAAVAGGQKLSKKMDKLGVKWCYVGYPSEELASKLGISIKLLKRFIIDGILIKKKILIKKSAFLYKNLLNSEFVKITDDYGTNITLKIKGRRINIDDGFISDEDIRKKDVGGNLPAGEVFIPPVETYGDGVLISPKRTDIYTGKMIKNIKLVFEKGRLNLKKTEAEKNERALKETIKKSIMIDRKYYSPIRTTNVAELGIGLNPIINKIIGYLLTDEKIGGTIHIAIGKNNMYGGRSDSCLHWDFISNKGITLEIIKGRKTKILIERGKIKMGD